MSPKQGPVRTININGGRLRMPMLGGQVVGDRLVPSPIEVDLAGIDGQPCLTMTIEVLEGVPRCTELAIRRVDGGREVRPRDLRAVELETWVEAFVSLCSAEFVERDSTTGAYSAAWPDSELALRRGMKAIRDVRKGSRRPMTGERRQRVADVYNAHQSGGIEAIMVAFGVSRATAIRYIKSAREADLITKKD